MELRCEDAHQVYPVSEGGGWLNPHFTLTEKSQNERGFPVCITGLKNFRKFHLRLFIIPISSQPAVFSPQRKTSKAHYTEFYKAPSSYTAPGKLLNFNISYTMFLLEEFE